MTRNISIVRTNNNRSKVMEINDKRTSKESWGYAVCVDTFLSGWGEAPGISYYILAVDDWDEFETVQANSEGRSDIASCKLTRKLDWFLKQLKAGDHASIVDKEAASAWYEPGRWS